MAEVEPCNIAATARSRGLSGSLVANEIADSEGATASAAAPAATCLAGVTPPATSGDCSSTASPAASYSPSSLATKSPAWLTFGVQSSATSSGCSALLPPVPQARGSRRVGLTGQCYDSW